MLDGFHAGENGRKCGVVWYFRVDQSPLIAPGEDGKALRWVTHMQKLRGECASDTGWLGGSPNGTTKRAHQRAQIVAPDQPAY